jgi:CheY-like chemotaxis protein
MDDGVLVLNRRPAEIRSNLNRWHFVTVNYDSVADALTHAHWPSLGVVIADVQALAGTSGIRRSTEPELRRMIAQLRDARERTRAPAERRRPLVVIVTSRRDEVAEHAAAIKAGADLYLPEKAAAHEEIIRSYLTRLLQTRADDPAVEENPAPGEPDVASGWMQVFALPAERLQGESGRLDAARIAGALGITLKQLATAIDVRYTTVHKTPDGPALQPRLEPFANVLAMLDEVFAGDLGRVAKWLQSKQESLGNKTPREAMLGPGGVSAVQQFVAGAWMGEPE